MITAIVKWRAEEGLSRQDLLERFKQSIPVYKGHPNLIRKYILFDPNTSQGMGVYLWNDRAAAEAFYEKAKPIIKEETGHEPDISFYDTPIIVDNLTGETLIDE